MKAETKTSKKNVFPENQNKDESDKYLFYSSKYSPVVKISDWFLPLEANPKDNDPYNPPGGNYFLSTYHRLGQEPSNTQWQTTTQAMLQQIFSYQAPIFIHKSLVLPHSASGLLLREKLSIHKEIRYCDKQFLTTYDNDFQKPFPYNTYPKQTENKPQRYGLNSHFSSPKICETKFLDDDINDVKAKSANR